MHASEIGEGGELVKSISLQLLREGDRASSSRSVLIVPRVY